MRPTSQHWTRFAGSPGSRSNTTLSGRSKERERAIAQVGQERRRDAQVEVDHLRLAEPRLRIEDLVEIAEREALAVDGDLLRGGHPLFLFRPPGRPFPRCVLARAVLAAVRCP